MEDVIKFVCELSIEMGEEKEWLLAQVYEDVCDIENDDDKINEYLKNVVLKKKLGWNHSSFEKYKKIQQEQDEYTANPIEAEEGVVQCKKCKSMKVYSISVQTRAADEPMTTISQCTICKSKWSHNN